MSRWLSLYKKSLLALACVTLVVGLASGWYFWDEPLLSPLNQGARFLFLTGNEQPASDGKIVYGYLPYWNLNKVEIQPELTHLAYFGLTIGPDGKIITREAETNTGEPGYHGLQSDQLLELSQRPGSPLELEIVLAQFDNDAIVALLNSPSAHHNLISSLDSLLLAYPITGVNIDIEYSGEVTPHLRHKLTELVTSLNRHLDEKYEGITLSIAMYASAADDTHLWDVPKLGEQVDYIIVMAYDFHRRSSPQAGPVAPLFGGKELWDSDISEHLQKFARSVPKSKLLLGVPFYGYEWQTTSRDAQAHTFPDSGATASFARVQELLTRRQELKVEESWNDRALSPYISYQEDGLSYVVYYENSRSISYKLDYVNQLDLGGIAIWALGYEGKNRELWDVIQRKL